ncbi:hypothetical protein FRC03_002558, partial [Tulasnella sp. 419]
LRDDILLASSYIPLLQFNEAWYGGQRWCDLLCGFRIWLALDRGSPYLNTDSLERVWTPVDG